MPCRFIFHLFSNIILDIKIKVILMCVNTYRYKFRSNVSFKYTRACILFFFHLRSPSISDATGRTVDHPDVTVAAKPKARDDEPWLIATRNKKLRFAFASLNRTSHSNSTRASPDVSLSLRKLALDVRTHASSAYFHQR